MYQICAQDWHTGLPIQIFFFEEGRVGLRSFEREGCKKRGLPHPLSPTRGSAPAIVATLATVCGIFQQVVVVRGCMLIAVGEFCAGSITIPHRSQLQDEVRDICKITMGSVEKKQLKFSMATSSYCRSQLYDNL